ISACSGVSPVSSLPPGNSQSPAIASPSGRCWTSNRPSRSISAAATTTSDVFGGFPRISADKLLTFLCECRPPRELYFSQGWNNAKLLQADAVDQGRDGRRIWADPGPRLSGGCRCGRQCRQFYQQYVG